NSLTPSNPYSGQMGDSTPHSETPHPGRPLDTLPQGEEKATAVRAMFDAIAPRYDMVNRIMTFRLDTRWRKKTVTALALPAGSLVLDLAAGTGDLCRDLQAVGCRPIGVDLSFGMLSAARTTAPLVQADATVLPVPPACADGATCGLAMRNLVNLQAFFNELARVVKPGGRIALLEVAEPPNPLMRWGHSIYFGKVVPLIGGLLSDPNAYRYLPRSVAYLPEPTELMAMLRSSGFEDATRQLLSGGISQLLVATRDAT
ncbi:MAG: ubiquinone/menaquinone biosynthesis methyltransferase, partial [Acidimicrobiales bacterium]